MWINWIIFHIWLFFQFDSSILETLTNDVAVVLFWFQLPTPSFNFQLGSPSARRERLERYLCAVKHIRSAATWSPGMPASPRGPRLRSTWSSVATWWTTVLLRRWALQLRLWWARWRATMAEEQLRQDWPPGTPLATCRYHFLWWKKKIKRHESNGQYHPSYSLFAKHSVALVHHVTLILFC